MHIHRGTGNSILHTSRSPPSCRQIAASSTVAASCARITDIHFFPIKGLVGAEGGQEILSKGALRNEQLIALSWFHVCLSTQRFHRHPLILCPAATSVSGPYKFDPWRLRAP